MDIADKKVLSWMLKGSAELNRVSRVVDLKLLKEAMLPQYKPTFERVLEYYSRYKAPPTYDILIETSTDIEELPVIKILQETDCPEGEVEYYVDKIKDRYNAFLIKKVIEDTQLASEDAELDDINDNFRRIVSKVERLKKGSVFSEGRLSETVQDRVDTYEYTKENPNMVAGVLSGYREIDDYTFGIRNSEFLVVVGASSSGKSMLMLNMAINSWLGSNKPDQYLGQDLIDDGKNVVYVSLEMSKSQLEARVDANLAQIRHKALSRGYLSENEVGRWERSLDFQKIYHKNFYIIDMPRGSRTMDIEARLESVSAEFTIDLLCIDYLGIMKPNTDFGQDWLEVGHVAADVHELCRKKDLPVISAAQKKAKDKKAKKSFNDVEEIGRSKMIGDNSNIVLIIESRDEEHLHEDMPVHIAKNRDGAKGVVYLEKEFEKSRINNYPEDWVKDDGEENEV
jgi:replicative DNA helicase